MNVRATAKVTNNALVTQSPSHGSGVDDEVVVFCEDQSIRDNSGEPAKQTTPLEHLRLKSLGLSGFQF